jgi:1,4-dihydroxy-6-naphthoate synthase
MQYGRGQSRSLIERFVRMYVNDITIEMGILGESAIKNLFKFATEKSLVPEFDLRIASATAF